MGVWKCGRGKPIEELVLCSLAPIWGIWPSETRRRDGPGRAFCEREPNFGEAAPQLPNDRIGN